MARLASLSRLTPGERRVLLSAWALLLVVPLLLRLVSLRRLLRSGVRPRYRPLDAERLAWLVEVAAQYAPGARCLPVALVTARLLARQGTPAVLRIGVARSGGRLSAHAWLERDGRPLRAGEAEGYTPILGVAVSAS